MFRSSRGYPKARHRRPQPAQRFEDKAGPFKGMRATVQGSRNSAFAEWLHNCYSADPYAGGEIVARPGRLHYPTTDTSYSTIFPIQLGTAGPTARVIQMLAEYRKLANVGDRYLVAIVSGKFYAGQSLSFPMQEAVNAATFTAAGITLNTVSPYYATNFNGKLVVVGAAVAFTWDGTVNGGITKLTNAGTSFFGRPVVYAGKLFFIKGDRKAILWSEEGDETIGYESGGYANAWDLVHTSQELITVLQPTNEALYYFRTSSIGAIYGASNIDFQTTSTLDAISSSIGTDFAEGVALVNDTIWFMDNQGRPCYFHTGSREIVPAWMEIERAFTPFVGDGRGYDSLAAPNNEQAAFLTFGSLGQVEHLRSLNLVFFTYRYHFSTSFGSSFDVLVGFHADTKTCQTVWSFPTPIGKIIEHYDTAFGTGTFALGMVDQFGYCYTVNPSHLAGGTVRSGHWFMDSNLVNGFTLTDVYASIIGPRHFEAHGVELRAKRLHIEYVGQVTDGPLEVRWATPGTMRNGGVRFDTSLPISLKLEGNAPDKTLAQVNAPVNSQITLGLNELGRWIAFGLSWPNDKSLARIVSWTVSAMPDNEHARLP